MFFAEMKGTFHKSAMNRINSQINISSKIKAMGGMEEEELFLGRERNLYQLIKS